MSFPFLIDESNPQSDQLSKAVCIQPSIIDQIEDSIHRLKKESSISIILVEQYLDFAKAASDNYYIMDRGTVVQSGESVNLSVEIIQKYLTV